MRLSKEEGAVLARSCSVEDIGDFKIGSLRYLSYPKCYKKVSEDIWHWAPLLPSEEKTRARITERKHQLYLENLTYREVDNLSGILVSKMREGKTDEPHDTMVCYISRTIRKTVQRTGLNDSNMSSSSNHNQPRIRRYSYNGHVMVKGKSLLLTKIFSQIKVQLTIKEKYLSNNCDN